MEKFLTLLCVFFLFSTSIFTQNCTIGTTVGSTCTLTMDGVLTIPVGFELMIDVQAWGAGGGSETAKNKRCGGGGGAYFNQMYSVTGGSNFSIIVGQGAIALPGGNTSFDFNGGGLVTVGGGGLGTTTPGLGGTGSGSITGGDGGSRETGGGLDSGGGGGGSGPGNGSGGNGGNPTNGIGGLAGVNGSPGAAGGAGGHDVSMGSTVGANGAFPGGGAGGKGTTDSRDNGAAGGNGQVIVSVTGVLPVELVHFNAKVKDSHILVEWQTASELNNRGYELQRSEDGMVWEILEFVEGKGTSNVLSSYRFIDNSPFQELNYYRLKQLDFDGKFKYSNVISTFVIRQDDIISYPNPIYDQLIIEGIVSEDVLIKIYNTIGQVVYQNTQFMDTKLEIDVSALKIGNYFINIIHAKSGKSIHQKLLVKMNN